MKLVCPHCNETFELSASQQTALMNQIRDAAFNEELSKREKAIESSIDSKYKVQLQEVLSKEHEHSIAAINAKVQEINDYASADSNAKISTFMYLRFLRSKLANIDVNTFDMV